MNMESTSVDIVSPMATGNGAFIIHKLLESHIKGYRVNGYHPRWTLFPFVLRKVTGGQPINLIHTTPAYAIFSCRKSIPLVISFQNYVLDRWMRHYSSWGQRLHYKTDLKLWFKLAVRKAKAITAVSRFTARLVHQDMHINRPIRIIYNGIDTDQFTPAVSSRAANKGIRVFYSGNLTRRKGAQWLPAIARKLNRNIKIYYTRGLRTRNNLSSHPALQPIGPVPYEKMPERYQAMDILVMPTVREGLSLSVLEAMASAIPVVASDCSSLPEQIDNGKGGYLCPVGDSDAFAEKINLLADSPGLRREMGEYNRTQVEKKFTLERMVSEYQILFEKILAG